MKKIILFLFLLSFSNIQSQNKTDSSIKDIVKFQKKLNEEFKSAKESPLTEEDLKTFKSLDFFEIDTAYRVIAKLEIIKDSKSFKMQTTTDRLPVYKIFAKASFEINGKPYILNIYQNEKLILTADFENHLFLPFTDQTNGNSSYGGGRYIDLKIPKEDSMVIDFNKSYNPYCAYNEKYSCPIPPQENHLDISINAGVKNYKGH